MVAHNGAEPKIDLMCGGKLNLIPVRGYDQFIKSI
jgi:hypothetical protein